MAFDAGWLLKTFHPDQVGLSVGNWRHQAEFGPQKLVEFVQSAKVDTKTANRGSGPII
jgi:hypothetical protein